MDAQQQPTMSLITSAIPTDIEADRIEFYYQCTTEELVGFVKARSKDIAPQEKSRTPLDQLIQLDRHARFPLLDLPKDIRLLVYEELLHHAPGRRLHSQILSTCKTIQDEAHGFLDKSVDRGGVHVMRIHSNELKYAAPRGSGPNTVATPQLGSVLTPQHFRTAVTIASSTPVCSNVDCKCRTESASTTVRHGFSPANTLGPVQNIAKELAAFPKLSKDANTIIVDIVIEDRCNMAGDPSNTDWWSPSGLINRHLYLLATAVQELNVKSISVRLTCPGLANDCDLHSTLWPLSRLGPNISVNLSGVPQDHITSLQKAQLNSNHAFTALTGLQPYKQASDELVREVQKLGPTGTGIQFLPTLVRNAFNMSTSFVEVHDGLENGVPPEDTIRDSVSRAAMVLRDPKWVELARRVEDIMGKTEATEEWGQILTHLLAFEEMQWAFREIAQMR